LRENPGEALVASLLSSGDGVLQLVLQGIMRAGNLDEAKAKKLLEKYDLYVEIEKTAPVDPELVVDLNEVALDNARRLKEIF